MIGDKGRCAPGRSPSRGCCGSCRQRTLLDSLWILPSREGSLPPQVGLSFAIPRSQPRLSLPPSVLGTARPGSAPSGAVPCSPRYPFSSGSFIAQGHRVAVGGALPCLCPQGQVAKSPICWECVKDLLGAAALGTPGTKRHNPDTTCPEAWKHSEERFGYGPV